MAAHDDLTEALCALRGTPRLLALAGCAVVRQLVSARADDVRPATRDALAAIEAWARGGDREVVTAARAAASEPSPVVVALYALASEPVDDRAIATLASLVPWLRWASTASGRATIAAHPKRSPGELMREPAVARALEGTRAELAALVKHVVTGGGDVLARYDAWLAGAATGDRPQPVIHHDRLPARPDTRSDGDRALLDAVAAHVARHVGPDASVLRDRDARWVRVDLHAIARPDELVLVTAGMAERPLAPVFPAGAAPTIYSELVMRLPASWPRAQPALAEPRWSWPLAWLGLLAREPHRHGVAYRPRQTTGPIARPGALPAGATRATDYDGALFVASTLVPPLALVGRTVEFLAVCPLFPSELAFARDRGTDALLAKLAARGVDPERVAVERPEVVDGYDN
jgi:hypothetical protein|nr:suppressor of fused domain protein [Kofleriaceae bacterium]